MSPRVSCVHRSISGWTYAHQLDLRGVDLRGVDRRYDCVATFKLHMLGIFLVARYDWVIARKGLACEEPEDL